MECSAIGQCDRFMWAANGRRKGISTHGTGAFCDCVLCSLNNVKMQWLRRKKYTNQFRAYILHHISYIRFIRAYAV